MAPETEIVDGESKPRTVFIDTSLDTHLATLVSDSDTVSDFKKKVVLEHRQCFPAFGDIKINCLKVKRKGNKYHMVDSMLIKCAFSSTKRHWFVAVDASPFDQDVTIQPSDKRNAGNQLALPRVSDPLSTDRHGDHGSPTELSKIVPFLSQKLPSVGQLTSGDSRKDVSKNLDEDKSSNEKQLDSIVLEKRHTKTNGEKSKKKKRALENEDALGSGVSVKKKRKSKKCESNVKASEEDKVSTFDTDKGINNADSLEHKSQGKDLSDDSTKINEGGNCNALDQLAIVVPSQDVGEETNFRKDVESSETVPDAVMSVVQIIQPQMPLEISQEKDNVLVQTTAVGNELPSSMRTSDCERDASEITSMGKPKGSKRSTKHKAAETESCPTSFVKKLDSINKNDVDSSQQDVGSTLQESADNHDKEKQGSEVKSPEKRKRRKKTVEKHKDESPVKWADNLVSDKDISSTVPAPVFDEKVIDERDEATEKSLIDDSKKGDEMIVKEVEISEPTESLKSRVHVENVEEYSTTVLKDAVKGRKKIKDVRKSASRNDESVVKYTSDVATVTNEEIGLPQSERKESLEITSTDADTSINEKNVSQVITGIINSLEKKNDNVRSRKKKKSASRNDESVIKHTSDDATVTKEEIVMSQSERKKSSKIALTDPEGIADNSEKQNDTVGSRKKKKSASRKEEIVMSQSERKKSSEIALTDPEGIADNSEKQNDTVGSRKKKKSASRNDESVIKHTNDAATVTSKEIVLSQSDRKESPEITLMDAELSRNEKNVGQVNAEGIADNSEKQNDTVRSRKKKKSASRNDEPVIKHASDAATVTSEKIILSQSDRKESPEIKLMDAELSRNEKKVGQVNAEGIAANSEKQNDTVRSRKKKKSASRNDEPVIKHTSEEIVLSQSDRKESPEITLMDAELSRNEKNVGQVNAERIAANSEKQNDTVRSRKKKKSASRNDENVIKHMSDAATVTQSDRNEKNVSQVNAEGINGNSEKQNDTMDGMKKSKRKTKTIKSAAINENDLNTKHANSDICENVKKGKSGLPDADKNDDNKMKEKDEQISDERVVKKAKKNKKPSVTVAHPQDLPSGQQSAKLELESKKSQPVDHDHLPEEASKNVTVSEVSKVNNETSTPKDESHKIVFMDYFTPGHQPDKNGSVNNGKDSNLSVKEKKTKKKTLKPPHLETTIQSQNIISENENSTKEVPTDVVGDPNKNIDQFKTSKRTKKIDPVKTVKSVHESSSSSSLKSFGRFDQNQKSNKQESVVGQTHADINSKSAPVVKSLLNAPETIFGNDNDDSSADDNAAVNSDSSTRTPSRMSSSSGDSDSSLNSRRKGSLALKRKRGDANSSINLQSKKMSMSDLLRSSSRFKKAKVTASQEEDTESQQVDFVPETQPIS